MMRFLLAPGIAVALLSLAGACGGPDAPAPAEEKPVEIQAPAASSPKPAAAPGTPAPEFAALPTPYNAANYAAGMRTWKLCASCHLTAKGAGHLVGPNLHGLFGRPVATAEGFDYSPALKAETFIWTPEQLDNWLANPRSFVPGNRMSFSGVRKPEDRLAVIAYLMVETGYGSQSEAE